MKTLSALSSEFSKKGIALIIVLAFVVLLTGLAVAFLSRSSDNRQIARASFNDTDADALARGALDVVVADLRQEIVNGSTASPTPIVSGVTIYTPTSAANMLPRRSGNPGGSPDPIPSLIRRSIRSDPIPAPGVSSRASAVNSATDPSINGRFVSKAKWNRHYLIPRISPTPSSDGDTTPVSSFTAPDWVLVTRKGPTPVPSWTNSLRDPTQANKLYVTGRYAFAVYDEGGLLDANVAGYPNPDVAPSNWVQTIGRKGYTSFADLTQLASTTANGVGSLVGWRNYASIQPGGTFPGFTFSTASGTRYLSSVLSNSNGFTSLNTTVWNNRTDQALIGRQSLIQLQRGSVANQFKVDALQYLGTFSRELNRPTWKPTNPNAINPDLQSVRVTSVFTRFDGSQAVVGETLLKRRFPLTRLSWLTYKGPSQPLVGHDLDPNIIFPTISDPIVYQLLAAGVSLAWIESGTPANVKASFGLVWDSRSYQASPRQGQQWVYVSPNTTSPGGDFDPVANPNGSAATTVKTFVLDITHPGWSYVQRELREPDFFEILKAVIINGSVGLGTNADSFVLKDGKYYDTTNGKSADFQLMDIGANIMDAWDTDNVPTWINFNGNEPTGIENLPYLNKLVFLPRFVSGNECFDAWLVPSLWNPHQNASSAIGTIRIALDGTAQLTATGTSRHPPSPAIATTSLPLAPLPATMDMNAADFGTPSGQSTTPLSVTGPVSAVSDPQPFIYWGFHYTFNDSNVCNVMKTDAQFAYPDFGTASSTKSVELQVKVPGTNIFVPYERWEIAAINHPLISQGSKNNFGSSNKLQDPEFVSLDPRTVRFGVWGTDAFDQPAGPMTKDYIKGAETTLDEVFGIQLINLYRPQPITYFTISPFPASTMYKLCVNTQPSDIYSDLDGTKRQADFTTDPNGIDPTKTIMSPNTADRQRLPSAPFQSVAELGQVFRDQPWKTLAFTISNSGDAGLLDVFTLQDTPLIAGKVSVNTRQSGVLNAIISQTTPQISGPAPSPPPLVGNAVSNISNALVNLTKVTPMMNKAEVVTRLTADSSITGLGNKEARDAVIRALSDATQTRTWNLMIDVIAQSGRYPPTAAALKDFVVEGEKRYWLHIAIDRFTGEVIDQQLEQVSDQ